LIITQPKELIGAFVNVRQGFPPETSWGHFNALALVRKDVLVAGVIYNTYDEANVNMHIGALEGSKWLTQDFLFAAFDYPFNELGKKRITAIIRESNSQAREFVLNLGFSIEGELKDYYANGDTQMMYGMLRKQCRFLDMKKAA
jgi:RimJ/RimL family protein N-acetyltransferase